MADLMLREKEFHKLNEKLNDDFKRSTKLSKIEKFKETRQNPLTSICYDTYRVKKMNGMVGSGCGANSNTDRFATYTKEKCPNFHSMRKFGGGDGVTTPAKSKSPTSPKQKLTTTTTITAKGHYGNTFNRRAKSLPKGTGNSGGGVGSNVGNIAKETALERRPRKNSTTASSVFLSSRSAVQKEAVLVYKNEKFTTSSSMDDVFKKTFIEPGEDEEVHNKKAAAYTICLTTLPPRAENTQPIEPLGSSCGKSSQKIVNTSSLIRFLKSKVALLEDHQAHNVEQMQKQKESFEASLELQKSLTQQLDKAKNRILALTEQLEKSNSQLSESNRRYREQSQECAALKKELENVKRELKHLTLSHTNLERRFQRTKEDSETAQNNCTSMRQSERELKENFRREIDTKNAEIKNLRRQRTDLFNAYKKQLFLIDNLRQQNICMEQAKMIDFCEREFSKILEWNSKA